MIQVTFGTCPENQAKYVVIAVRYQGQWIWVRHKKRSTWEIPGGHREPGETASDAAKRELWEETGLSPTLLLPVTGYCVQTDDAATWGLLFYAEADTLPTPPARFEIAETMLEPRLPQNLTYPDIQPALYRQVQGWLNIRTNPDELWDLFDENRRATGRTCRRGDVLPPDARRLTVQVWVRTPDGRFLLTRRSPNKGYSLLWECTGGSATAGDTSLDAACRELAEETGLAPDRKTALPVLTRQGPWGWCDVWLFCMDIRAEDVVLQPGETCEARLATAAQLRQLSAEGWLCTDSYLEELLAFCEKLNIPA